jgi:hypothetical protein
VAGQGGGGGSSPHGQGNGEAVGEASVAVLDGGSDALVIHGGAGAIQKHEGEDMKVRGKVTWPKRLRRRRSPERGTRGGGSGIFCTILVKWQLPGGRIGQEANGEGRWCSRPLEKERGRQGKERW